MSWQCSILRQQLKVMQLYKSRNSQGSPRKLQHIGTSGFPLAAHTMLQTALCLGTCTSNGFKGHMNAQVSCWSSQIYSTEHPNCLSSPGQQGLTIQCQTELLAIVCKVCREELPAWGRFQVLDNPTNEQSSLVTGS